MAVKNETSLAETTSSNEVVSCKKCTHGNKVTVEFPDATFIFHSQWLHDAHCNDGAARNAMTAICEQPVSFVHVTEVHSSGHGLDMMLDVSWDDGLSSKFPALWLRVMAPLVAKRIDSEPTSEPPDLNGSTGWLTKTLKIPEISFKCLFGDRQTQEQSDELALEVLYKLLDRSATGIVKIIDSPEPNIEDERNHVNNINTRVLKRLFGAVWAHPIRGQDTTFNVSSHTNDANRAVGLPNYDTTQLLLPHTDHAFYDNPIQVMGFYCLEGESENTWVSVLAALSTFKEEYPHLYEQLCRTRMALGRVSLFYGDPLYQATVDTAIVMHPGSDQVKRARWHPNLTGSLLVPYDEYKEARLAHQKFQEIIRRDSHQLKLAFKPGDYYIWDNFRMLHGRERVLQNPRTGVGQTVPEQVVHDRYRALHMNILKNYVEEAWLVHMPMPQLCEMLRLVRESKCLTGEHGKEPRNQKKTVQV